MTVELRAGQRAAIRVAIEALKKAMREIAFDANVARMDPGAPPSMQRRAAKYMTYEQSVKILEEMVGDGQ